MTVLSFGTEIEGYPGERAMQFIQTHYWVAWTGAAGSMRRTWKFAPEVPNEGVWKNKSWERPSLEDVLGARWDGRSRTQAIFQVGRKLSSSEVDPKDPVYKAREAARKYLQKHGVKA